MRSRTALLATLLYAPAWAQSTCPARSVWPGDDWVDASQTVAAAKAAQIQALEDYAFTLTGKDSDRIGIRTDAVVIVQHGQIIYERYARGWSAVQPHIGWSVAKSVTSALAGIAVGKGALNVSDSVCDHATLPTASHCDVTVRDLLEFASGLDWAETYEGKSNQSSSVLALLYGEGHGDMLRFMNGHGSRAAPGASYSYSSADATWLGGVVDGALKPVAGDDYPWALLFDPIGMKSAVFERDPKGTTVGASYVYATARDYARFGYLYLNDGCWNGQRILPVGWVSQSTSINTPVSQGTLYNWSPGDVQGWMWWLNVPLPSRGQAQPWADVPQGAYQAEGHWGQSVTIIPQRDLVIVRNGDDRDHTFAMNQFLSLAMAVGD